MFLDDERRRRTTALKLYGKATYHPVPGDELVAALGAEDFRSDGPITVEISTSNWNCPKYITPRFTENQVKGYVGHLEERIADLEGQLQSVREGDSERS